MTSCLQFEQILAAYKAQSKLWKPILNKFAEGKSSRLQMHCPSIKACASLLPLHGGAFGTAFAAILFQELTESLICAAVRMRGRKRAMVG